MSSYDPWRSQSSDYDDRASRRNQENSIRSGRSRAGPPAPLPSNPQPYSAASAAPRSPTMHPLMAETGSTLSSPTMGGGRFGFLRQGHGGVPAGLNDEKKVLQHSNSSRTLAEEYEGALDKGFSPNKQTRGSMAAQMAAAGEIPKKAGLRMWRSEEHAGTFLRGGKKRACFRCCVCTFILAVLIVIAVIVAFLLWVRPPNVQFEGVEIPAGIQDVVAIDGGFQLNFNLLIGVVNPNYFGAFFPMISAQAFYPLQNKLELGGGTMTNVDIHKRTNNTIHFPFQINYTSAIDPGNVILTDIADKCGFIQGATPSPIKVDYTLLLKIRVIAIDVSPSFSSSTTFNCPLQESDIDSLLKQGGVQGIISETGSGTNSANGGGDRRRDLSHVLHGMAERSHTTDVVKRRLDHAPVERALGALDA